MKKLVFVMCMLLVGCDLDNDEIIKEVDKCKAASLDPQFLENGITFGIRRVQCIKPPVK